MELFDRLQTPDSLLNKIQDRLVRVINAIARKPILDGRLITGISLPLAGTSVEHGLGRTPRGWLLAGGNDYVYETEAADDKFLYLRPGGIAASPEVSIWVF